MFPQIEKPLVQQNDQSWDAITQHTTVILPRIAVVKYVDAQNALQQKGGEHVPGYLWSARSDRGKCKGLQLVRALFAGAGKLIGEQDQREYTAFKEVHVSLKCIARPCVLFV